MERNFSQSKQLVLRNGIDTMIRSQDQANSHRSGCIVTTHHGIGFQSGHQVIFIPHQKLYMKTYNSTILFLFGRWNNSWAKQLQDDVDTAR